jgi:glutathione S-transferase
MTLKLHSHPLSSYCWKVLIALYEAETAFEAVMVNLGDPAERERYRALSPFAKIPALEDTARGTAVWETSIIVEYLDRHHRGPAPLLPADPEARLLARQWDRVFDQYVMTPMQKIVADRLRPEGRQDPHGTEEARAQLAAAYGVIDRHMAGRRWAAGEAFSLADCAAAPALFYAHTLVPFGAAQGNLADYFERLIARPSVALCLEEAKPFLQYYPYQETIPARFR